MTGRFISYLRVSTTKQGEQGLGIDGQRAAVASYLNGGSWELLGEFVEVESGKNNDRPKLAAALEQCRLTGATLVVAKIDRLARNAEFLLRIVRESGKGGVVFCDLPDLPAGPTGKFMLTQMAAIAELEAGLISQRTKAALAAAKARGTNRKGEPLRMGGFHGYVPDADAATAARQKAADGFAGRVGPMIQEMRQAGASLREIAGKLAADGIRTARGGAWTPTAVSNVLKRLAA